MRDIRKRTLRQILAVMCQLNLRSLVVTQMTHLQAVKNLLKKKQLREKAASINIKRWKSRYYNPIMVKLLNSIVLASCSKIGTRVIRSWTQSNNPWRQLWPKVQKGRSKKHTKTNQSCPYQERAVGINHRGKTWHRAHCKTQMSWMAHWPATTVMQ